MEASSPGSERSMTCYIFKLERSDQLKMGQTTRIRDTHFPAEFPGLITKDNYHLIKRGRKFQADNYAVWRWKQRPYSSKSPLLMNILCPR